LKALWLVVWLGACSIPEGRVSSTAVVVAQPRAERGRSEPSQITIPEVPAEPFSAAWEEDELEQGPELDAPRHAWVKTDACADPMTGRQSDANDAHGALVSAVLDPGKEVRPLASFRVFPTFRAPRALDLLRGRDGTYRLRTTTLPNGVWSDLVAEAVAGNSQPFTDTLRQDLLVRVTRARVVSERRLDATTARLLIELWREVIGRAQVVEEVNPGLVLGHFTGYQMLHDGSAASTRSPQDGSVLGTVVLAAEHLESVLDNRATDEAAALERARDLIREALDRTRRKEPCLRHYDLPL
jgi:hypothetical protein